MYEPNPLTTAGFFSPETVFTAVTAKDAKTLPALPGKFLPPFYPSAFASGARDAYASFRAGRLRQTFLPFLTDEFEPCVLFMRRESEGIYVLWLFSAPDESVCRELTELAEATAILTAEGETDLLKRIRRAGKALRNLFREDRGCTSCDDLISFFGRVAFFRQVFPICEIADELRFLPAAPHRGDELWFFFLTCAGAALTCCARTEERTLRLTVTLPRKDYFLFRFEVRAAKSAALLFSRTANYLNERGKDFGWTARYEMVSPSCAALSFLAVTEPEKQVNCPPPDILPGCLNALPTVAEIFAAFLTGEPADDPSER